MGSKKLKSQGRYSRAFFFFASARRSVFFRRLARFLALSLPLLFPISLTFAGLSRCSNGTKPRAPSALLLLLRSVRHWRRRILNFHNLERPKERGEIDHVVRS